MAPPKGPNHRAVELQPRRAEAASESTSANVPLHDFCCDWEKVFSDPTVIPRPAAVTPTDSQAAEARYYPQKVVAWTDFEPKLESAFQSLSSSIRKRNGDTDAVFPPSIEWKWLGENFMRNRKLRNEAEVTRYEWRAVEEPINLIFSHDGKGVEFQLQFESGGHPSEGVAEKQQQQQQQQQIDKNTIESQPGAPNPAVIEYKTPARPKSSEKAAAEDKRRVMDALVMLESQPVVLSEKIAPDMLTKALLQLMRLPINMEDVRQFSAGNTTLASDKRQRATAAVAFVVIQAYDYMIRKRVRYAYITSSVVHVFLYFKEHDPNTLYFYQRTQGCTRLTRTRQFRAIHNVVSTVASFIHMASEDTRLPRNWPQAANVRLGQVDVAAFEHVATPSSALASGAAEEDSTYIDKSHFSPGSPLAGRKRKATAIVSAGAGRGAKPQSKEPGARMCADEAGDLTRQGPDADDDDNPKGFRREAPNNLNGKSAGQTRSTTTTASRRSNNNNGGRGGPSNGSSARKK